MGLLDLLRGRRNGSAKTAKERLQIVITHERANRNAPDYLPLLKKDLMEVIAKYVDVDNDSVSVTLEQEAELGVLELNITLPDKGRVAAR
ncbi:cell division topological specificity factor MinE [Ectothiorhodospiraceae bacterium 2226]|nr:cell division topological specificity factor MinE [Ectothiorhodospiraceae bacterium 2226]